MAASRFSNKDDARTAVWDRLQVQRLARFPFPPHGRIPNFAGADRAARRLFELAPWKNAKRLKIRSGRKPFDEGFRSMCRRLDCAAASCCSIPP